MLVLTINLKFCANLKNKKALWNSFYSVMKQVVFSGYGIKGDACVFKTFGIAQIKPR